MSPTHQSQSAEPVLVTGGAGFIGSAVTRHLLSKMRAPVVVIDALTYAAAPEALPLNSTDPAYSFVKGDIRDRHLLERALNDHRPQAVINLAAETHVDRSIEDPVRFADVNVTGTASLLEVACGYWRGLDSDARSHWRFIQVSTDEVFGDTSEDARFTEESSYRPRSPYAASKAAADHFVRAFHQTFGFPTIVTHSGNNYGPYQFPDKLIPHMVACCIEGRRLPVYGDGKQFRDWIHVEDHAAAICALLERGMVGESYLIGAQTTRRNSEVVGLICEILDRLEPKADGSSYSDQIEYVIDRPGHDSGYSLDTSKIASATDWNPQIEFEDGLEETIRWYLENREWLEQRRHTVYSGHRLGLP